jgi:hypothetical protein
MPVLIAPGQAMEQRLQTSIEKNAEINKKAQTKIEYDLSSG